MSEEQLDEVMEKARRCEKALYALEIMDGNKVYDISKLKHILEGTNLS